jgi:acetyl esterase/lipase
MEDDVKEYKDVGSLTLKTKLIILFLKINKKFARQKSFNLETSRKARLKNVKKLCGKPCKGVKISTVEYGGFSAQIYTHEKLIDNELIVLYLHGGAYIGSNVEIYGGFVSKFARDLGFQCCSLEYPLAPEYPYPSAVNATVAFYNQMIASGCNPSKIIFAGDSAGAGLALAASKQMQEERVGMPGLFVLFSPWVDLTMSGNSITRNATCDLIITKQLIENCAQLYCAGQNPKLPGISPIFDEFKNFPPVYLLAADDEILLSDSERLHDILARDGVDVNFVIWRKTQHAFVVGAQMFPESKIVVDDIKRFIYTHYGLSLA